MKKCSKCSEEKEFGCFRLIKYINRKKEIVYYYNSYCKDCYKLYEIERRPKDIDRHRKNNNKSYQKHKDKIKQKKINSREKYLLDTAKYRAKKKNLEFNLTIEDIIIPKKCPLLNTVLTIEKMIRNDPNSPSIDRIDSNKGYIKSNIKIISYRANMIKNNITKEESQLFFENLKNYWSK